MLPQCYPNYETVHRRLQQWFRDEVLRAVLTDVANTLRSRARIPPLGTGGIHVVTLDIEDEFAFAERVVSSSLIQGGSGRNLKEAACAS
jgi:hypothetical protein